MGHFCAERKFPTQGYIKRTLANFVMYIYYKYILIDWAGKACKPLLFMLLWPIHQKAASGVISVKAFGNDCHVRWISQQAP